MEGAEYIYPSGRTSGKSAASAGKGMCAAYAVSK